MKHKFLFKTISFYVLVLVLFCFGIAAIANTTPPKRPDLSYQVVFRNDEGSQSVEVIESADSIYEAIAIYQKRHPDDELISINRRSYVDCEQIHLIKWIVDKSN